MSNPSPISFGAAPLIVPEQRSGRMIVAHLARNARQSCKKKIHPWPACKVRRDADPLLPIRTCHRSSLRCCVGPSYTHRWRADRRRGAMAKGCFVVRAEVPDKADRSKFDDWYATDHLPWAIKAFGAQ